MLHFKLLLVKKGGGIKNKLFFAKTKEIGCFSYIKGRGELDVLFKKGGILMEFQIKTEKGKEISFKVSDAVAEIIVKATIQAIATGISAVVLNLFM